MKEINVHTPVVTNIPDGDIHRFSIKQNQKMYKILSDTLYSNKPVAIIRELSCNALDSHIAAGNAEPFHVYLPNQLDEMFKIRDFGVGLSVDQVYKIFTVYGESTKTDSNDFVGSLGLGSKSPFSYVDSFNVISVYNGKKYFYTAFKDQENYPSIMKAGEEETDEGNGVEISFPVSSRDHSSFINAASEVLSVFPVGTYKIFGSRLHEISSPNVFVSGANWWYNAGYSRHSCACVIQGNVRYPIDIGAVKNPSNAHISISSMPIEIVVPIGTLDYQPSREKLSYDDQTINNLKNVLDKVFLELREKIEEQISSATTYWGACSALKSMMEYGSKWEKIIRSIMGNNAPLYWNGENLVKEFNIPVNILAQTGLNLYYRRRKSLVKITNISLNAINRLVRDGAPLNVTASTPEEVESFNFAVDKNAKIFVTHKQTGIVRAVTEFAESKHISCLYCVVDKVSQVEKTKKYFEKLTRGCPVEEIKLGSIRINKDVTKAFQLNFNQTRSRGSDYGINSWIKTSLDKIDLKNSVVLMMEGWNPVDSTGKILDNIHNEVRKILKIFDHYGQYNNDISVIGIRKIPYMNLLKSGKLNNTLTYETMINKKLSDFYTKYKKQIDNDLLFVKLDESSSSIFEKFDELVKIGSIPKDHWTIGVIREVGILKKSIGNRSYGLSSTVSEIITLFEKFDVKYEDFTKHPNVEQCEIVKRRYPMISLIDSYFVRHIGKDASQKISEYIQLVDEHLVKEN